MTPVLWLAAGLIALSWAVIVFVLVEVDYLPAGAVRALWSTAGVLAGAGSMIAVLAGA